MVSGSFTSVCCRIDLWLFLNLELEVEVVLMKVLLLSLRLCNFFEEGIGLARSNKVDSCLILSKTSDYWSNEMRPSESLPK